MQAQSKTGMLIDGIFASEVWDSSGERINIDGCDISEMEAAVGVANYEHRDDKSPGASANDIVGRIVYAKKILKASDAEDDRQKEFWNKIKVPFIYGIVRLFDGSGHPNAMALAAMVRDMVDNDEKILVRFSIEGVTLKRDGQILARCIARDVALTIKPCNRTCDTGLLLDPMREGKRSSLAKGAEVEQDLPPTSFGIPRRKMNAEMQKKCVDALAKWAAKGCSDPVEDILKAEMGELAAEHLDQFMQVADQLRAPSVKKSEQLQLSEPARPPEVSFDEHRATLNVLGSPLKMKFSPKDWQKPDDLQAWEMAVRNFISVKEEQGDKLKELVSIVANALAGGTRFYSTEFGGDGRLFADQMVKASQEGQLASSVPPLGVCEARMVVSLAGSGNALVPSQGLLAQLFESPEGDLVRFGLLHDPQYRALWSSIDKAFYRYHPAVVFVLNHPEFGAFFRRNPEQAILPAQWLLGGDADDLAKAESLFDHKEWASDIVGWRVRFGEAAAVLLFYRHIAGLLKAEAPKSKLAKMMDGLLQLERMIKSAEKTTKIFDSGSSASKAPGVKSSGDHLMSADHGLVHNGDHGSEQNRMVHGVDLSSAADIPPTKGRNTVFFAPHPTLGKVFVKKADASPALEGHKRELMYHNLAHEVFGLGDYLPKTAAAEHPTHGNLSVHEVVDGEHYKRHNKEHEDAIDGLRKSGELDKLELMNHLMGNCDRHMGNFMMTPSANTPIKLIDHDLGFLALPEGSQKVPAYGRASEDILDRRGEVLPKLHPAAAQWLGQIKPEEAGAAVLRNGGSPAMAQKLAARIQQTQATVQKHGGTMDRFTLMGKVHNDLDPKVSNWFKMHSPPHGEDVGL